MMNRRSGRRSSVSSSPSSWGVMLRPDWLEGLILVSGLWGLGVGDGADVVAHSLDSEV